MKAPPQVLASVEARLKSSWPAHVAQSATGPNPGLPDESPGECGQPAGAPAGWPHAFPLGAPAGEALRGRFAEVRDWAEQWRDWARTRPATLRTQTKVVAGTRQQLPTHLVVDSLEDAATLCGDGWPERLETGAARARIVSAEFPTARATLASRVRELTELTAVDFDLLRAAATWFARHDATGLTPRQVPIEGLHTKWLATRQPLVAWLAGRTDLGLAPPHPARIHFTYLDPDHLAGGGRRHDSATVGDADTLPYRPRVVLISENKDTAVHFPPVPGGVAVEGAGYGGKTAGAFGWITGAPTLVYWGDLDAHGFEILDGYRRDGVPAASMLMDAATYEAYLRFGTNLDAKGQPLVARPARDTPALTAAERDLYERLTGPAPRGPRRVEQERISLRVAHQALLACTRDGARLARR